MTTSAPGDSGHFFMIRKVRFSALFCPGERLPMRRASLVALRPTTIANLA